MSNQALSFIGKLDRREESMILSAALGARRPAVQGPVPAKDGPERLRAPDPGGIGQKRGDAQKLKVVLSRYKGKKNVRRLRQASAKRMPQLQTNQPKNGKWRTPGCPAHPA